MKILCSGLLFRHPVGGHTWHHLQYLVGLQRLGHSVAYFEDFGWKESWYDPDRALMAADPSYGIGYMTNVFDRTGFAGQWWYLAEDGVARGGTREELAEYCRDCDL